MWGDQVGGYAGGEEWEEVTSNSPQIAKAPEPDLPSCDCRGTHRLTPRPGDPDLVVLGH